MSKNTSQVVESDLPCNEISLAKDLTEKKNDIIISRNTSKESRKILTITSISICQNCKESFNTKINMPYLFKCGHFFCKNCIVTKFVDNNKMIKCPEDETKVNSLQELKLLNNLIANENELKLEQVLLFLNSFVKFILTKL